jgi:hypothetical protein
MLDDPDKLKSSLIGFLSLSSGATMGITIPSGSIVNVFRAAPDSPERTQVKYGDRSSTVLLQELLRCGTPVEGVAA